MKQKCSKYFKYVNGAGVVLLQLLMGKLGDRSRDWGNRIGNTDKWAFMADRQNRPGDHDGDLSDLYHVSRIQGHDPATLGWLAKGGALLYLFTNPRLHDAGVYCVYDDPGCTDARDELVRDPPTTLDIQYLLGTGRVFSMESLQHGRRVNRQPGAGD